MSDKEMSRMVSIKKNRTKEIYGIIAGAKYATILTVILWWIPIFGPMLAGYIGGRKSGSPLRGFIATLVPIALLTTISILIYQDVLILPSFFKQYLLFDISVLNVPYLVSYFTPVLNIFLAYMMVFESLVIFNPPAYIILISFGYIGGIMSAIARKDKKYRYNSYQTQPNMIQSRTIKTRAVKNYTPNSKPQISNMQKKNGVVVYQMDVNKPNPIRQKKRILIRKRRKTPIAVKKHPHHTTTSSRPDYATL